MEGCVMHPDKHLERAKNELEEAINGYANQRRDGLAYELDNILITLNNVVTDWEDE